MEKVLFVWNLGAGRGKGGMQLGMAVLTDFKNNIFPMPSPPPLFTFVDVNLGFFGPFFSPTSQF